MNKIDKWVLLGLIFFAGGGSAYFGGPTIFAIVAGIGALCSGIVIAFRGKSDR